MEHYYEERPCPICGKPQQIVERSNGRNRLKQHRNSTCGSKSCISELIKRIARASTQQHICTNCKTSFIGHTHRQLCDVCRKLSLKRRNKLAYSYKLTVKQLEALKTKTFGLCAICEQPGYVVDHDHKTNKVRGWLCAKCNLKLSVLESPEWWLRRAKQYLKSV